MGLTPPPFWKKFKFFLFFLDASLRDYGESGCISPNIVFLIFLLVLHFRIPGRLAHLRSLLLGLVRDLDGHVNHSLGRILYVDRGDVQGTLRLHLMTGKIIDYDDDVDSEKDYKNFILNDVSAYVNDDVEDSDDESLLLCVDVAPNSCGNDGPQGQLLLLRHLRHQRQVLRICVTHDFVFVS